MEQSRALFGAAALFLCLIGPGWSPAAADGHGPARILELLRQHDRLQGAESEVAAVRKEFDAAKSVWRPQFDLEIKAGLEEILNPDADDTELEFYEGKPIAFGLGNFVWQAYGEGRTTAIAQFVFEPDGRIGACLIPVYIESTGHPVIQDRTMDCAPTGGQ